MRKFLTLILTFFLLFPFGNINAQKDDNHKEKVDYRIDNMGYWKKMAKKGLVDIEPYSVPAKAIYKGSRIDAKGVATEDSPDVPVSDTGEDTQSENSIFVSPEDNSVVLNSNNSKSWTGSSVGTLYGTSYLISSDFGESWTGSVESAGGSNSGIRQL